MKAAAKEQSNRELEVQKNDALVQTDESGDQKTLEKQRVQIKELVAQINQLKNQLNEQSTNYQQQIKQKAQ